MSKERYGERQVERGKHGQVKQEIVLVNQVPIKDKYPIVNDRYIVFSNEPYTGD